MRNFQMTYFEEHLWTTASDNPKGIFPNISAIRGSQDHYKLKPPQPLFSECENTCFIAFLSTKRNQSCSKSPHQNGRLWTKWGFVARKTYFRFPKIIPVRTVNVCDIRKPSRCFWVSLDVLGEINFRPKLRLRASNFSVWKLLFRQKKKVKGRGDIKKIWWVEGWNLQWSI